MKFNVLDVRDHAGRPQGFHFSTSAENLDVALRDASIVGDIKIDGNVVFTGTGFHVEGNICFDKHFQCDRCLEIFTQPQKYSFSEEYRKLEDKTAESDDVIWFSGDVIDFSEMIRENIILAQPLNNICSEACKGLCMKCGANLNNGDCGCDRTIIDPRLAALQKLLSH